MATTMPKGAQDMKLNRKMLEHDIAGSTVMVAIPEGDEDFQGVLRVSPSAEFIVKCLEDETDEDGILAKMREHFDGEAEDMRADIRMVVGKLQEKGMLE